MCESHCHALAFAFVVKGRTVRRCKSKFVTRTGPNGHSGRHQKIFCSYQTLGQVWSRCQTPVQWDTPVSPPGFTSSERFCTFWARLRRWGWHDFTCKEHVLRPQAGMQAWLDLATKPIFSLYVPFLTAAMPKCKKSILLECKWLSALNAKVNCFTKPWIRSSYLALVGTLQAETITRQSPGVHVVGRRCARCSGTCGTTPPYTSERIHLPAWRACRRPRAG